MVAMKPQISVITVSAHLNTSVVHQDNVSLTGTNVTMRKTVEMGVMNWKKIATVKIAIATWTESSDATTASVSISCGCVTGTTTVVTPLTNPESNAGQMFLVQRAGVIVAPTTAVSQQQPSVMTPIIAVTTVMKSLTDVRNAILLGTSLVITRGVSQSGGSVIVRMTVATTAMKQTVRLKNCHHVQTESGGVQMVIAY